jgi:hypothetical protein
MIVSMQRRHSRYRELTPGRPYGVIGIEANDFRILNDQGRPFLYPARIFTIVERREPEEWISEVGEEGERYQPSHYYPMLRHSGESRNPVLPDAGSSPA